MKPSLRDQLGRDVGVDHAMVVEEAEETLDGIGVFRSRALVSASYLPPRPILHRLRQMRRLDPLCEASFRSIPNLGSPVPRIGEWA